MHINLPSIVFRVGVALALNTVASGVWAAEADPVDFALRLPAAMTKFSSAGDVAGFGGASAGSRYPSGVNPASLDWQTEPQLPWAISPQWSQMRFEHGPRLDIGAMSITRSTLGVGSVQISAAKISNHGDQQGDFVLLEGDYLQLQWGKKFSETLALGLGINFTHLNTKAGMDGLLLVNDDSRTRGLRAGLVWGISPRLLAGLMIEHGATRSDAEQFYPGCFCLLPGRAKGSSRSARAGLTYEYQDQSSLYVDFLSGRFNNDFGALRSRTDFAGIEHRVMPGLFARAGYARGHGASSATVGLGIAPAKNWSIDLAYQRDMFPELHPEFGRSRLFNVSLNLSN